MAANKFASPLQKAVVEWLAAHPDVGQAELARDAEIDASDMRKICKGEKGSLSLLGSIRLAAVMNLPVETLAGEDAPDRPGAAGVIMVATSDLAPSPTNPRGKITEESVSDLADSIAVHGVLQNLLVTPIGEAGGPPYMIVAGERRYRASLLAIKRGKVPADFKVRCLVLTDADDGERAAIAILENLQREDVDPVREAAAFVRLHALNPSKWTTREIARLIGKTQRFVQGRIALDRVSDDMKVALREGRVSIEAAQLMADAPKVQDELLRKHKDGAPISVADVRARLNPDTVARAPAKAAPEPEPERQDELEGETDEPAASQPEAPTPPEKPWAGLPNGTPAPARAPAPQPQPEPEPKPDAEEAAKRAAAVAEYDRRAYRIAFDMAEDAWMARRIRVLMRLLTLASIEHAEDSITRHIVPAFYAVGLCAEKTELADLVGDDAMFPAVMALDQKLVGGLETALDRASLELWEDAWPLARIEKALRIGEPKAEPQAVLAPAGEIDLTPPPGLVRKRAEA